MTKNDILNFNLDTIEPHNIKILIADDHPVYLNGLKDILMQLPYVKKVDAVQNGKEVLKNMERLQYHVVFLDINMPEIDGLETLRTIRLSNEKVRIVMLSMESERKNVMEAYDLKANGYVIKGSDLIEIKNCISEVLRGNSYYTDLAVERVLLAMKERYDDTVSLHHDTKGKALTTREIDVLKLICREYSNPEIAKRLTISVHTVKGHREKLKEKIGCKNSIGMVQYAIKHGLHNIQ